MTDCSTVKSRLTRAKLSTDNRPRAKSPATTETEYASGRAWLVIWHRIKSSPLDLRRPRQAVACRTEDWSAEMEPQPRRPLQACPCGILFRGVPILGQR